MFSTLGTVAAVIAVALIVTWLAAGTRLSAAGGNFSIFRPFPNDDGKVQSAPAFTSVGPSSIDSSNTFFSTGFGTNGQSCATCHEPSDGFTIHVTTIQNAFNSSGGADPLFRPNDTANDPNSAKDTGSVSDKQDAYSLILALGVMRISIAVPAGAEFVVAPQNTAKFGPLPDSNDPQHPGQALPFLSLFRRPLVPTNMRFDSAVLWDGRANITNIRGQVAGAARTLLLNPNPSIADEDDVARFQLAVMSDQVQDNRSSFPSSFAGNTSAQGADGGVTNLVNFAFNPASPCIHDATGARTRTVTPTAPSYFPSQGDGVLTPSGCTPVQQGGPNMTTFKAWLTIPIDNTDITNISRRQIAHGEEIFNNANLHIPPDMVIPGQSSGDVIHCTTCHATNNIGNHPEASFFVRLGSDSVQILRELADAHPEEPSLQDFVTRTAMLPQYCLRSTASGAPSLGTTACGSYNGTSTIPGDVITSDPGRAMITGKWADIGKFKPPILRDLATRSPYFHGSAADSTVSIIDFYNARFNIGLTQDEKNDLVRFVEAH